MKTGTIIDFLKLAADTPELARELVQLATRFDFEFSDELNEEELESVAGGADLLGRDPMYSGGEHDVNAFVQAVSRDAYLLQNESLKLKAEQVNYFNAPKESGTA